MKDNKQYILFSLEGQDHDAYGYYESTRRFQFQLRDNESVALQIGGHKITVSVEAAEPVDLKLPAPVFTAGAVPVIPLVYNDTSMVREAGE